MLVLKRLEKTEESNRDEVADKEEGLDECEGQRNKENREEYVEHTFLRVLRADLDYFFAIGNRSLFNALKTNICLDELHGPIGSGGYGLSGSAGKPVNNGAAGDQSQHKWSM